MDSITQPVKLTKYSHGGGCGCKISPRILDRILASQLHLPNSKNLLVGYRSKDDAAVYDIGNGEGIISTTDFFMPIVDDPEDFGRIAATNAISDIYAMAGTPIMAIAILGWPVDKLSPEIAQQVIDGGRIACADAHIPIAGGHSIDAPEPIFGLAVTGRVALEKLKQNNNAKPQDQLYLTKPLGVGILTTAEKKQCLLKEHRHIARDAMCTLNRIGQDLGSIKGVNAMTDITGFGLLGHLIELCEGSHLQATLEYKKLPLLPGVEHYQKLNCIPRGTQRNYDSYGYKASAISEIQKQILCDPQTSGGLLVSVSKQAESQFHAVALEYGLDLSNIGKLSVKHKECFVNII